MGSYLVTIEAEKPQPLTPVQVFEMTAAREIPLSCLLVTYVTIGLLFMLLTLFAVNLLITFAMPAARAIASPAVK
jgi:hypothetical protein